MPSQLLLGALADDFTGAADLASMLMQGGVRTALLLTPTISDDIQVGDYQALVCALKTRSIPARDACKETLQALESLRSLRARQFYFKYCSTFDSSTEGNIGPVAASLMDALGASFTVAVPALPVNERTLYQGYLFVGDCLLSETHMRHHPVHPMTESNLVRHLQAQTDVRVGLIAHEVVRQNVGTIEDEIHRLIDEGIGIALVDALTDADLIRIAEAVVDLPLVTGGSGLGAALAEVWNRRGDLDGISREFSKSIDPGRTLILSGSCSDATLRQLAHFEKHAGSQIRLDVVRLIEDNEAELQRIYAEVRESLRGRDWALVYSSASSADRKRTLEGAANHRSDGPAVGSLIESAHAELAKRTTEDRLVEHVVVAGGETSGAVAKALNLTALEVVNVLDPGVPIMIPVGATVPTVTLKSGNFGSRDFFSKALRRLGPHPEDWESRPRAVGPTPKDAL